MAGRAAGGRKCHPIPAASVVIIAFAKTTGALLAGQKTVTRRDWTPQHAAHLKAGQLVDAWNYTPRVNSARLGIAVAHKVATIRLMDKPRQEMSDTLSALDYEAEGFAWMTEHGLGEQVRAILRDWRSHPRFLWVVRFELVEVVGA